MASKVTPMDRLHGLAWSLPHAFREPVAGARFEQGDVLYRDPEGYAPGAPRLPAIQILEPPRSTRAPSGSGEGGRFASSWRSPVVLDVYRDEASRPERRTTTQGRLFACLWRDDLGWLDDADPDTPPVPLQARDLHRALEPTLPVLREALGPALSGHGGTLFVMVRDDASEISGAKAHSIEHRLAARFAVERCERALDEAGVVDADQYHPSLLVLGLAIGGARPEQVTDELRPLLYGGKGEGDGARFSLARHGWLEAVEPTASAKKKG